MAVLRSSSSCRKRAGQPRAGVSYGVPAAFASEANARLMAGLLLASGVERSRSFAPSDIRRAVGDAKSLSFCFSRCLSALIWSGSGDSWLCVWSLVCDDSKCTTLLRVRGSEECIGDRRAELGGGLMCGCLT